MGLEVFGRVGFLAVDEIGTIYLFESMDQEIRVFDSLGHFSHAFGRKGEGPGEFTDAEGFALSPDGRIWISDSMNRRISVFSNDGAFLKSFSRIASGYTNPWQGSILPSGELLEWTFERPESTSGTQLGRLRVYRPIRYRGDGSGTDSFPPISFHVELVDGQNLPYANRVVFTTDEGGQIWFGRTHEYEVYRRTLEGDTTFHFSFEDYRRTPVSNEEAEDLLQEYQRFGIGLSRRDIPEFKPILGKIVASDDGHILVFPRLAGHELGEVIDIFNTEGTFLKRVSLPFVLLTHPSPVMRNGSLYGVVLGEFDIPQVVRVGFGKRD